MYRLRGTVSVQLSHRSLALNILPVRRFPRRYVRACTYVIFHESTECVRALRESPYTCCELWSLIPSREIAELVELRVVCVCVLCVVFVRMRCVCIFL